MVIIGIFGGHQYRPGYISIYLLWQIVNITWNVFIVCFYLDIGPYTQSTSGDYNLVNLGTGSRSWFEANGPLCNAIYNVSNLTDHIQLIKPVQVNGCYLDYRIIECVQAGIQILFAINTFLISFFLVYSFSRKPYAAQCKCICILSERLEKSQTCEPFCPVCENTSYEPIIFGEIFSATFSLNFSATSNARQVITSLKARD